MNIFVVYFWGLFVVASNLASAQISENQLRIVFNNGEIAPDMSCTESDMVQLLKAIDGRRFLRANIGEENRTIQKRTLQTYYPASCKRTCAGYTPGTCLAQGCRGYRRTLNEGGTSEPEDTVKKNRRILQSEWCANAVKHADNYLDSIINAKKVSSSCINLLQTSRQIDCMIVTC